MKRNRNNSEQEEASQEGAPEWMTTYSDMVTLLLTFFIMLFSMSSVDEQKYVKVANSMRSSFMHLSNGEMFLSNSGKNIVSITEKNNAVDDGESTSNDQTKSGKTDAEAAGQAGAGQDESEEPVQQFKDNIAKTINDLKLGEHVTLVEDGRSLILRLDSLILFDSGSADIKSSGKKILSELGSLFNQIDQNIVVQGHTDNLPIDTLLFPSNWELSTKRATNVVKYLIDETDTDPIRFTATGNAEFQPIAPNDTEENRQRNRRIDIVFSK